MRLILVVGLIFISGTVHSKFYIKRRYDRSINDDAVASRIRELLKKEWTYTDYDTHFRAYKDREEGNCYLEKLLDRIDEEESPRYRKEASKKVLYASNEPLTKFEAWQIAGSRIINFCIGRRMILLQSKMSTSEPAIDPFLNTLLRDENDIVTRRVADIVLTPLISRAKRQATLEEIENMLNERFKQNSRLRRQVQQSPGKFRGQAQSQYLNVGNNDEKEGRAEAEATHESSRAVVSGSRGMGQAQSMSLGSSGCEDCPKYSSEDAPDRYIKYHGTAGTSPNYNRHTPPGTGSRISESGSFPLFRQPGDANTHPGIVTPGTATTKISGDVPYHSRVPTTGPQMIYHSKVPSTPAGGGPLRYPGHIPGSGITYPERSTVHSGQIPGSVIGGSTHYPGQMPGPVAGGGAPYPGQMPGPVAGGGASYPGQMPGSVAGAGASYPGQMPGPVVGGGASYPGQMPGPGAAGGASYPGQVPGSIAGGDTSYPGQVPGSIAGGDTSYPGQAPGSVIRGSVPYSGQAPGSVIGGSVPHPGQAPSSVTGGNTPYPEQMSGSVAGGGAPYPGQVPGSTVGEGMPYPGQVPGSVTGRNVPYPSQVPGSVIRGSAPYPGQVPGSVVGGSMPYPGQMPGSVTGGSVPYPSQVPGSVIGGSLPYPEQAPGPATGGNAPHPGQVPGSVTRGSAAYPGKVPSSVAQGRVPYSEQVSGSITEGSTPYPEQVLGGPAARGNIPYFDGAIPPPRTSGIAYSGDTSGSIGGGYTSHPGSPRGNTGEHGTSYPDGLPVNTVGSGATYRDFIQGSKTSEDTLYPPGSTLTTNGRESYPSSISPGTRDNLPGQLTTQSKIATDTKAYPNGQIPNIQYFSEGHHPASSGDTYQGINTAGRMPEGTPERTGTTADSRGFYPSGISPPANQQIGTTHYPGSVQPGIPFATGTMPRPLESTSTSDRISYPGTSFQTGTVPSTGVVPNYSEGTRGQVGPDNTYFPKFGADQSSISYRPHHVQYPKDSTVQSPGSGIYSTNHGIQYPGYSPQERQYPVSGTWQDGGISRPGLVREPTSKEGAAQENKQYSNDGQTIKYYPGLQYPSNVPPIINTGDIPQYYQQPSNILQPQDDNANSQASSSVKQTDSGTQASASAQGKFGRGTAQSQVTGTYSGSGSFSAQAGSSDDNKSVQTEINGGKEGASSNAQGVGGYGKSQAQVQLNSESGATTTGAQSSGWNHGTNSQVQASSRGGMADAQANGEGSTSSQAQIGFQPYLKADDNLEKHAKPFHGGGTASAQSGTYTGQSQSQLEGSFQYGITYTGAAQAGSGSGATASRKAFNFNLTDTELFKPFIPQIVHSNDSEVRNSSSYSEHEERQEKFPQGLLASSSSPRKVISMPTDVIPQSTGSKLNRPDKSHIDDTVYDYEEEYDAEDYESPPDQPPMNSKVSKTYIAEQNNSHRQAQAIHVTTGNQYDIHLKQHVNTAQKGDILQPGESLSGFTIPSGFRGRVTSIAGDETISHGSGRSQSQTLSLIPKETTMTRENKSPVSEIRSLKTNRERLLQDTISYKSHKKGFPQEQNQQSSMEYSRPMSNASMKPSYYTITNSVAGKMDDRNSPRKYEHRYYTKSSTCGYFTFSCNVVYGSNGRTKICKPKMPTHPDGTPMKC